MWFPRQLICFQKPLYFSYNIGILLSMKITKLVSILFSLNPDKVGITFFIDLLFHRYYVLYHSWLVAVTRRLLKRASELIYRNRLHLVA